MNWCYFALFGYVILVCSSILGQRNQTNTKAETPLKMPIRRNLCASLPQRSPPSISEAQAFDEGMFPLQVTPEPSQKTVQAVAPGTSVTVDPNMTFEVVGDDPTACDDTVVISTGTPCGSSWLSGPSQLPNTGRAQEGYPVPPKR